MAQVLRFLPCLWKHRTEPQFLIFVLAQPGLIYYELVGKQPAGGKNLFQIIDNEIQLLKNYAVLASISQTRNEDATGQNPL